MEAKINYSIVGFLVLILIVAFIFSSVWLTVGFDKKSYDVYAVYMREAATGLSEDAPVKYNGVKVGFVKSIKLNRDNPQQVQILLSVEHGTPITTSTTATLISQGITGTTYVGLAAKSPDLTPLLKKKGQPFPVIPTTASLFNQLDNALKGVSENINSVTLEVKRVFDKENAENIKDILMNLDKFSKTLGESSLETQTLIKNAALASKSFPSITNNLNSGLATIAQHTVPEMNLLLQRLNRIAINLEKASSEVKQNPSVLVRGATPRKPGPGE
ncbi:MAG: ABC transporter substrate-binding protein [Legionellales bacterium RIFCSPHIGHO2_12_FULL_37_14]|nr:MAG: ABC transporter substrate-binding protein [Legionellales bacterium RIFCSPHIGHO2_12_FULL_37_14]